MSKDTINNNIKTKNPDGFRTVIVIPNYNGLRFLDDCMKAIDAQTVDHFVTLVIDNGSGEEDTKWLKSWQEKDSVHRKLILNKENLGFSGAVNQGIRFAMEHNIEFTLLLNNDTKVAPDFVEVLENRMDKDSKKKVFAISSKMVKMHDPSIMDDAGDQMTVLGWQFQRGLDESSSLPRWNTESEVFSACAGAAMYRTGLFEKVGLFDENHFAYLEDIDLCYRAQLYGYKVLYCPEALVHHVGSGTSGSKYNDFKVRLSARNSLYLLYKNLPLFMVILNIFPILAGYLIKILFFTKKGFFKPYMEGIFEAFGKFKTLKRAKINEVPPMRYLTLELRLIAATFEYASRLMRRYSPKARG
ncbi:Glycosyltransferase, GT2 family [Oribacterium sp. KHPX15]|uniref:glycosyltransferase family 2 protein n=1 Tax=Oribacterium sp. KHPX15 TaxID=1855342 RepID=UPI0008994D3E|nr:glycosyltransferase family 2 protein [Oribacterium sp. KHPX15]SEA58538.1 Glycosyltransferase, GT2 family [Oribacterium sp. KHPX15]